MRLIEVRRLKFWFCLFLPQKPAAKRLVNHSWWHKQITKITKSFILLVTWQTEVLIRHFFAIPSGDASYNLHCLGHSTFLEQPTNRLWDATMEKWEHPTDWTPIFVCSSLQTSKEVWLIVLYGIFNHFSLYFKVFTKSYNENNLY